jgi:hypothetical protein
VKTVWLGLLQGPVVWLLVSGAISLLLQIGFGVSPPETIGASLISGAFASVSVGLLLSAFHRWRERSVIVGGVAGVAPEDGANAVLVGMLEATGPLLRAPLDGSPCVAYDYEIHDDRGTGRQRTITKVARGIALTPASIVTRTGSYRLLAVPALEANEPSVTRSQMIANFNSYAREAIFIDQKGAADELVAQWEDTDGRYRSDVAYVALGDVDTSQWVLRQQHLPAGSQVCVFGRYSQARSGIVPSTGGPVRVVRGNIEHVAASLRSKAVTRGLLGVACAAAAAGIVWLIVNA